MDRTFHSATYQGTITEWEALAEHCTNRGETRLAKTIQSGLTRQKRKYQYPGVVWEDMSISLRFRDGSIHKINAAIVEYVDQPDHPLAPTWPDIPVTRSRTVEFTPTVSGTLVSRVDSLGTSLFRPSVALHRWQKTAKEAESIANLMTRTLIHFAFSSPSPVVPVDRGLLEWCLGLAQATHQRLIDQHLPATEISQRIDALTALVERQNTETKGTNDGNTNKNTTHEADDER